MGNRNRTRQERDDSQGDKLSRLLAVLLRRIPSLTRRASKPERDDSGKILTEKWQSAATEGISDLYDNKVDKSTLSAVTFSQEFPQPSAEWQVEVPNSNGLKIMSSLVLSDYITGTEEPVEHQLIPNETAADAQCTVFFNETIRGKIILHLGVR